MNGRAITGAYLFRLLHYWEEFQSLATKWQPNKAEMNRLCAMVEDKCLNHFKNILKKEKFSQHTISCNTQSNAPEDGQNFCLKHVELNWIYQ